MTSMNKLRLSQEVLDSTKEQLISLQEREDTDVLVTEIDDEDDNNEEGEEDDELESGIVVAKNISLETYLNYSKGEARLTVKMRFLNGKVIIYEIPIGPHAAAIGEINRQVILWHSNISTLGERKIIRLDSSIRSEH